MSKNGKSIVKVLGGVALAAGVAFVGLKAIAKAKKPSSVYEDEPEQKNPLEGKKVVFIENVEDDENADGARGHLEAVGDAVLVSGTYDRYVKRCIDVALSFGGLVLLSPLFAGIALAIKIEDPGPVFFTQKRVGRNKQYFKLHKFRSMKVSTPHDVPTHMLENPEQYITKVGRFLRAHSLDELPQIWDIFVGNMSVIGPRPGLWNQDVLTAERDKYGANAVRPGLTGWAQINGRDELEIPEKARLDGEYVANQSLLFDAKCFFGTVSKVGNDDSVVEGGTGAKKKVCRHYADGKTAAELIGTIGFGGPVEIDAASEKRALLVGASSYIGQSFKQYAAEHYPNLAIEAISARSPEWKSADFSSFDVVFHVAGIAHADVSNVDDATKEKYYEVNTDLAVEVCKKAKIEGVKTFVFMSSMIVYGDSAPYGKRKVVDEKAVPEPANFYGDSKLQADVAVRSLASDDFKVLVLRPPMIYGRGSKGNYPALAKLAKKLPVFPNVDNERSMLHIDNLCEFLCQIMLIQEMQPNAVVLFPQNGEWTKTTAMVKYIAATCGKKVCTASLMAPAVALGGKLPGASGKLVNKAFGNFAYAQSLSAYPGIDYQKVTLQESIGRTEGEPSAKMEGGAEKKLSILVVSQYFHPESFRINDMCREWVNRGHRVTVVTGIPNYPMGKTFDGYGLTKRRRETWEGVEIIRIPLVPRGSSTAGMMVNYVSFVVSGVVASLAKDVDADVVFSFEVSPMTQVLVGTSFAKRLGIPHFLYVQDLWPENVKTVTGISNPAIIEPIDKMVDYIYENADEIFTTSPSFVEAICSRKRAVSRDKVHYWPQYAEDFYYPREAVSVPEIPDDGSFKIAFTGNIGTAQGLQILPRAAELLKSENIKFVMVGDGRYLEEFCNEVSSRGVGDCFVMIPRQPAERIPELLAACNAAFLSFQDDELWAKTIPAKLQSYMACGMPIIASAQGETERVIEESGCGVCCEIGDAEALSRDIIHLVNADLTEKGRLSREYFKSHFDKKMLMDEMEEYFAKHLSRSTND